MANRAENYWQGHNTAACFFIYFYPIIKALIIGDEKTPQM